MRFNFSRAPLTWSADDLATVSERLTEAFPRMPLNLRRAIVSLAASEIQPGQGLEHLIREAIRYARECPPTIGTEAALSS